MPVQILEIHRLITLSVSASLWQPYPIGAPCSSKFRPCSITAPPERCGSMTLRLRLLFGEDTRAHAQQRIEIASVPNISPIDIRKSRQTFIAASNHSRRRNYVAIGFLCRLVVGETGTRRR